MALLETVAEVERIALFTVALVPFRLSAERSGILLLFCAKAEDRKYI